MHRQADNDEKQMRISRATSFPLLEKAFKYTSTLLCSRHFNTCSDLTSNHLHIADSFFKAMFVRNLHALSWSSTVLLLVLFSLTEYVQYVGRLLLIGLLLNAVYLFRLKVTPIANTTSRTIRGHI